MPGLFTPLTLRGVTFKNRVFVSPMCQYSSIDGMPTDWHLVHLGSRAVGGAGMVMVEATGVSPEGRISPSDSGLWSDAHARAFAPITRFIAAHGAVPAIQLAHAGRKASTRVSWDGGGLIPSSDPHGWTPLAPSPIPFHDADPPPHELTLDELDLVESQFVRGARLALDAGFQVIELHMAHGYLLNEFLSPLSNHRADDVRRRPAKAACAFRCASPARCAPRGPRSCRCSCASRRPTGRRVAGRSRIRWSSRGACARKASISSTARAAGSSRTRRSRSAPATRCRSRARCARRRASRPAPSA